MKHTRWVEVAGEEGGAWFADDAVEEYGEADGDAQDEIEVLVTRPCCSEGARYVVETSQ